MRWMNPSAPMAAPDFKLKANANRRIIPRLREIAAVLTECCGDDFHCTLDGNEQFHDLAGFRDFDHDRRPRAATAL